MSHGALGNKKENKWYANTDKLKPRSIDQPDVYFLFIDATKICVVTLNK